MSKSLSLGLPLEFVASLFRRRLPLGNGGIQIGPGALDDLPAPFVKIRYARLPLRRNVANFLAKVAGCVHRKVARLAGLAGEAIARLFLRQECGRRHTGNRTDEKTGEESTPAIAFAHN